MQSVAISIVLAAYNGSQFIREQIDSILQQTYSDFELLICDDCSTDDTFEILEEYAQKDARIRIFQNKQNLGFKKNFERLLTFAQGEYIALSDQDDIWTDDHLEKLINAFDEEILLTCGNALLVDACGKSMGQMVKPLDFYISDDREEQFLQSCYANYAQGCCLAFKAILKKSIIPIPQEETYHDYWILWVALANGKIGYINDIIVQYRQSGKNVIGAQRITFINRIKNVFFTKQEFQQSMSLWLQPVKHLPLTASMHCNLKIAQDWWECVKLQKPLVPFIRYYIKNYHLICCTKNNKYKILRIIKKIIFKQ